MIDCEGTFWICDYADHPNVHKKSLAGSAGYRANTFHFIYLCIKKIIFYTWLLYEDFFFFINNSLRCNTTSAAYTLADSKYIVQWAFFVCTCKAIENLILLLQKQKKRREDEYYFQVRLSRIKRVFDVVLTFRANAKKDWCRRV